MEPVLLNHVTRFLISEEEPDIVQSLVRSILSHTPPPLNVEPRPLANLGGNERPRCLIGQLTCGEHGELLIRDKTAAVCCVFQEPNLSDVGQYFLIWGFEYVQNIFHSYLEIIEYKCLSSASSVCRRDPTSVECDSMGSGMSDVTGLVVAVSTPISNSARQPYLFVELQTATEGRYPVVITNPNLQCCFRYLVINECYLFSNMKDSILNKGQHNQLRVKTTTQKTAITRNLLLNNITVPHLTPGLMSYQGTITKTLIPEAGLYELDNSVRLYITHLHHFNNGEGLRQGAVLVISNVHLLKVTHPNWQFLSGFVCCVYSSVRILHFSTEDSTHYKPFHTKRNRLKKLLDRYSINHVALMLAVYSHCREQLQISDVDLLLAILHQFIQLHDPVSSHDKNRDPVSAFFSSPHSCSTSPDSHCIESSCSSFEWPHSLPTLAHFKEFHCQQDLGNSTDDIMAWTKAPIQWYCTESTSDMLLIGRIVSDWEGEICITDFSNLEKIPIISQDLLPHIGSYIIITKMKVVVEHTVVCATDGQDTAHHKLMYVLPITWKTVSSGNQSNPIPLNKKACSYFFVTAKNRPTRQASTNQSSFQVQVRMASNIEELSLSSGAERVLVIEDVDRYYGYLQQGYLYCLVSCDVSTSAVVHVRGNCSIELLEESEKWDILPLNDISELVDTISGQNKVENMTEPLVTFKGFITNRSHRLSSSGSVAYPKQSGSQSHSHSLDRFTLALDMRSMLTPDSIILYIHLNQYTPPPGLVPGAKVKCIQVMLKWSHSSNAYCIYCPLSSIRILHFPLTTKIGLEPVPPPCDLPPTYLSALINQAKGGALSRKIVCIFGRLTGLQYIKMELECPVHGTGTGGLCSVACADQRNVRTEARGTISDGSGECLIYFDSPTVKEILKPEPAMWNQLTNEVEKHGAVKYYRPMEPQNPGEALLCTIAKSSKFSSEIKVLCQPFTSKQGQGITMKKVKLQMVTYTVEVPQKLQLKAVAIQAINYLQSAKKLYDTLS